MVRALLYLGAAGVIWIAEGFIFSQFLGFSRWQVILMAAMYIALFCLAVMALVRQRETQVSHEGLPSWRLLSLAPMLTLTVGSFASLPLLLFILAVGNGLERVFSL